MGAAFKLRPACPKSFLTIAKSQILLILKNSHLLKHQQEPSNFATFIVVAFFKSILSSWMKIVFCLTVCVCDSYFWVFPDLLAYLLKPWWVNSTLLVLNQKYHVLSDVRYEVFVWDKTNCLARASTGIWGERARGHPSKSFICIYKHILRSLLLFQYSLQLYHVWCSLFFNALVILYTLVSTFHLWVKLWNHRYFIWVAKFYIRFVTFQSRFCGQRNKRLTKRRFFWKKNSKALLNCCLN